MSPRDDDGTLPLFDEPYNGLPPHVRGSETSLAAGLSVAHVRARVQGEVLAFLRARGAHGATDDEVEVALGLSHQSASARRRELVLKGWVFDSGRRRVNRSRRYGSVWLARGPTLQTGGKRLEAPARVPARVPAARPAEVGP